jgi:hypothetical protein
LTISGISGVGGKPSSAGVRTAYASFRKAGSIERAVDAELYFYAMLILRSGLRF